MLSQLNGKAHAMFAQLTHSELQRLNDKLLSGLMALDPDITESLPMIEELAATWGDVFDARYDRTITRQI